MANLADQQVVVWFVPSRRMIFVTDGVAVPEGVQKQVDVHGPMTRREAVRRGLVREGTDYVMVRRGDALQYAGAQMFAQGYDTVKVLWHGEDVAWHK